jgi:hypothetical protein
VPTEVDVRPTVYTLRPWSNVKASQTSKYLCPIAFLNWAYCLEFVGWWYFCCLQALTH